MILSCFILFLPMKSATRVILIRHWNGCSINIRLYRDKVVFLLTLWMHVNFFYFFLTRSLEKFYYHFIEVLSVTILIQDLNIFLKLNFLNLDYNYYHVSIYHSNRLYDCNSCKYSLSCHVFHTQIIWFKFSN